MQPLQEQGCSWQVSKNKSISRGCWKPKDVPGAARKMNSCPGRLDAPWLSQPVVQRGSLALLQLEGAETSQEPREMGGVFSPCQAGGSGTAAAPGESWEEQPLGVCRPGRERGRALALLTRKCWRMLKERELLRKLSRVKFLVAFWECAAAGTGSFLLPARVSPPWHPGGIVLLSGQPAGPAWGRVLRGTWSLELGLLSLESLWLGRGEEQWNMIHTWEQKITCICRCFHVYNVEKILERRILILPEEKGEKKSVIW